jgi:hypothetical protein
MASTAGPFVQEEDNVLMSCVCLHPSSHLFLPLFIYQNLFFILMKANMAVTLMPQLFQAPFFKAQKQPSFSQK